MERINVKLVYTMICMDCGSIFQSDKDGNIFQSCPHCEGTGLYWITNEMTFWHEAIALTKHA